MNQQQEAATRINEGFIGVSRIAPYAVYVDGAKVAEYAAQSDALAHYRQLLDADVHALADEYIDAPAEQNEQTASANDAKLEDKCKGITKQQAITAFDSLVNINLSKALGDGKGLYGDDGARVRRGTPGGKHAALWNPVILAIGLHEKSHAQMPKLKKAFFDHPFLSSWLDEWQEKLELLGL